MIVLATLTMTLGNLVALTQDNVKRMLAYSSIAHTGYMLVGLAAWAGDPQNRADGIQALLFYGVAYAFMNLGAFAVIAALQKRTGVTSSLGTFAGLGRREPLLGVLMTLFLLSLIGIPPTAGFFAKTEIILAAVEAGGPLDDPGDHHGAQRRGRRVLLPAGRRLHVHARLAERSAGAPPRGAAVGRAGHGLGVHDPARAVPDRAARRRGSGGPIDRGHDPELT